ncbi:hypothetical protein BLA60_09675 [Actinophytocola xinjiangensis]|uniref:DUF4878 domain-containing protein n=1 Tax=Actinophytocola xinjiangensis TaxID=485602 RepID=A0A7Z1AYV9_9PSEU|nr:hypothetical protein [Actinophytocola xinjiangensis]OLF12249.1 hypothetical protein BLA60_09675 [Actinophytocola xinjiangensis]
MTYPPQQPGPAGQDPYGRPPQQPHQPQQPYGQQPPPYGGQPQQPYGGGSSYQGLGSFGPAGPPQGPPARGNNRLVITIVLIAVLVLGGGGATFFILNKDDTASATNKPEDVRDAYMTAYETKSFDDVVGNACSGYKSEYGTDTSTLENELSPFTIEAKADGEPEVSGNRARANINLELSGNGKEQTARIYIDIVQEGSEWKFCGEGEVKGG